MGRQGRVIALDVGDKRIGVAVSDPLRITAQPHSVLNRTDAVEKDVNAVARLVSELNCTEIVLGLPLNNAGQRAHQAEKVLVFADLLRQQVTVSVFFEDERYTTSLAEKAMRHDKCQKKKKRQMLDAFAAQQILASYLSRARLQAEVKEG